MSIPDPLRAALAEHAELPFTAGRMLPIDVYRSEAVLAEELDRIFAGEWVCLGRTASLPNVGDYLTGELPSPAGARSVVVMRGDDGELRAFDNVCIHRGAQLLDGCGNENRITCPYHAWAYRTDGTLIGAPYMNRSVEADGSPFDPAQHSLDPLALEVWEGFVFVSAAKAPEPLAPRLAGLTEIVAGFAMAGYVPVHQQIDVWDTNWKLLVENFMDAYHVFKVHKATFGKHGDNTLNTEMFPGTDAWAHHMVVHGDDDQSIAHPHNTTLEGMWRKAILLVAVFPTHVIQLQPNWLWYLQISPLGVDKVRIRWEVAVAPELLAAQFDPEAYVSQVLELLDAVNAEDRPIVESVLRGMHRPQFTRGPLSYYEQNVYDFDRYIARALAAE